MRSRIDDWHNLVRQLLLIPLIFVLYSGPAIVSILEHIFDDEMYGASSPLEWAPVVFVIWLFAVPFVVAYAKWDDSRDTSIFSLGAFVGSIALFTMVGAPILKVATDLVLLPFTGVDNPASSDDVAFWIARICTFIALVGIPLAAITLQIIQMRRQLPNSL